MSWLRVVLGRKKAVAVLVLGVSIAASAAAQRGRFGQRFSIQQNPKYDGMFQFCRVMFRQNPYGDGDGWSVDYPRADINFPYRLSELTSTLVSKDARGDANHVVLRLTDPELFRCPFIMLTEPGGAFLDEEEAAKLREYLLKGGFLWADDFWGERAWANWEEQVRKVFPGGEFPIVDLPPSHAIFHELYEVRSLPQISSIGFWQRTGGRTSERGAESATAHTRGLADAKGNLMILMTHNTDLGDAFERESDSRPFFETFAAVGYAFGINALLYAMTH